MSEQCLRVTSHGVLCQRHVSDQLKTTNTETWLRPTQKTTTQNDKHTDMSLTNTKRQHKTTNTNTETCLWVTVTASYLSHVRLSHGATNVSESRVTARYAMSLSHGRHAHLCRYHVSSYYISRNHARGAPGRHNAPVKVCDTSDMTHTYMTCLRYDTRKGVCYV